MNCTSMGPVCCPTSLSRSRCQNLALSCEGYGGLAKPPLYHQQGGTQCFRRPRTRCYLSREEWMNLKLLDICLLVGTEMDRILLSITNKPPLPQEELAQGCIE